MVVGDPTLLCGPAAEAEGAAERAECHHHTMCRGEGWRQALAALAGESSMGGRAGGRAIAISAVAGAAGAGSGAADVLCLQLPDVLLAGGSVAVALARAGQASPLSQGKCNEQARLESSDDRTGRVGVGAGRGRGRGRGRDARVSDGQPARKARRRSVRTCLPSTRLVCIAPAAPRSFCHPGPELRDRDRDSPPLSTIWAAAPSLPYRTHTTHHTTPHHPAALVLCFVPSYAVPLPCVMSP